EGSSRTPTAGALAAGTTAAAAAAGTSAMAGARPQTTDRPGGRSAAVTGGTPPATIVARVSAARVSADPVPVVDRVRAGADVTKAARGRSAAGAATGGMTDGSPD